MSTGPIQFLGLERLPGEGTVIVPSRLGCGEMRALEEQLSGRPLTWLAEEHSLVEPEVRDYLLDSGFSAADVSCGYSLYSAQHFAKLDAFPLTFAWYARITKRPAFQASLPPVGDRLYAQGFYEVPA